MNDDIIHLILSVSIIINSLSIAFIVRTRR